MYKKHKKSMYKFKRRNQTGTISQQMRHASQMVALSLPLKELNYILFSVHWHWHSVSTLTVLTQYGYGPYSNIIFHGHYHSKRHSLKLERVHPNSNILERVHPYSNMTFKKGLFWNSNGLTPIHFAAIHGFLYILALKIDFCGHYFRW